MYISLTVPLVVAVSVHQRQVGVPIVSRIAVQVMCFDDVPIYEYVSTEKTLSVLPFQHPDHSSRFGRITAQPASPVDPVAIVW